MQQPRLFLARVDAADGPLGATWAQLLEDARQALPRDDDIRLRIETVFVETNASTVALPAARSWLAARLLLLQSVSRVTRMATVDCQVRRTAQGKPFLLDARVDISLSHTNRWVAAATACPCCRIGTDLVELSDFPVPDVAACMTLRERDYVRSCPVETRALALAQLWALKECVLKALGCGLAGTAQPGDVECDPPAAAIPECRAGVVPLLPLRVSVRGVAAAWCPGPWSCCSFLVGRGPLAVLAVALVHDGHCPDAPHGCCAVDC